MEYTSGKAAHIGIEASRLLRERRGTGRYVRSMLVHMVQQRPTARFTVFVGRKADIEPVQKQLAGLSDDVVARCTLALTDEIRTTSADVVWYPANFMRHVTLTAARVVTVLDLAPMLQLDHRWWKWLKRGSHRARYRHATRDADMIVAISSFTAHEVQRVLSVDASKVRVTLLAADDLHTVANERSATLEQLNIVGPFFLTVGAQDARKNLRVLYDAMELLHARGERVPLVQCGPSSKAAPRPWLHRAGYVTDGELATLYQRATALVFPSYYEGFGLPALEAMAAGGRVVCADASSLPEVVGDAALLFPWNDASALATQLTRVLHDEKLRDKLTHDGAVQASKFRWSTTAARTLEAFDEAVARRALRR